MDDVDKLDKLTTSAFTNSDPNERNQALIAISPFNSLEFWKVNAMALKKSVNPFTLQFVSSNLTTAFTQYHNSLSPEDRQEVLQILFNTMANLSQTFYNSPPVREALVGCFCRVQKLSWFEFTNISASEAVVKPLMPFLTHSLPHSIFAISILSQLVKEMSEATKGIPLGKQRKISYAFREDCLREIFRLAIESLQRLLSAGSVQGQEAQKQQMMLMSLALDLVESVLSFDFIGTFIDETSDGITLIYAPSSWESVFTNNQINLFLTIYENFPPPFSSKSLSVIEQFAGIRCSIFSQVMDRKAYLETLINGIGKILMTKKDLSDDENKHRLARILVRLKYNFQLKYLVEIENYKAFIDLVAQFSSEAVKISNFNTVYYILNFWTRMVAACVISSEDIPESGVLELAPKVLLMFCNAVLESVSNVAPSEDGLASEQLESILEEVEGIARCCYSNILMYLCGQLSRLIKHYQMAVAQGGLNITNIQRQLAWIIYFSSSVLNVRSRRIVILDEMHKLTGGGLSPPPDEEVVSVETDLICMVFECMNGHDAYLGQQRSSLPPSTVHLELALISFLQKFCKNYISDDAFDSSNNFYHALEKKLGMQNPLMVIERVVQKVIFLIEKWSSSPAILEKSLGPSGLFMSLVNGWTSSKLMGKSSVITSLLKAHITINPGDDLRSHAAFYKALGRLLFSVYSDESTFYEFVAPWQEDMAKIQNYFFNVGKVPDEVHMKFRCLMEDMRGLLSSIITHLANHSGYLIFFEWFYTEMRYMDWMVELLARGADLNLEVEVPERLF
eukprot:TRINITY_DN6514_c0_g1_i1.p1 TRINITY_DN6514_c0_g1~~TRINITY_DN6514_c0_g1_i1.p1  ORF type:complete len:791 (-),score=134.40 TRINITY_DN6514_c0_g1_i1:1277-3649(-)